MKTNRIFRMLLLGARSAGMNRLLYKEINPEAYRALLALEGHVRKSGLDHRLLDLIDLRVSQINGCAFCVDMHSKDLRAAGESEERRALVCVWREAPSFTPRERAALAFAEAVTTLGPTGVPDAVYEAARTELGDRALVDLTLAIATINAWNRLGVTFQSPAGAYQPKAR
jgi:AhpD family alkylhydroperoxidase